MRFFLVLIVSLIATAQASLYEDFIEWTIKHTKEYEDEIEHFMRFSIWQANTRKIENHNKGNHSYTLGMNEFGDMTHKEFLKRNGYHGTGYKRDSGTPLHVGEYECNKHVKSVDWRKHGLVSEVKDQGQCGSCYSFSATGSLEGQIRKVKGKPVSLSEQQIVDCSDDYGDMGCNGGLMDSAFKYIRDAGGLESEKDYPYETKQHKTCSADPDKEIATLSSWVDIPQFNEKSLTHALAHVGPVSVAIDASHYSFQFYEGGVYDEPSCSQFALDHGVLAVGFGRYSDGKDYYIVKNSWGPNWGLNGYLLMKRNDHNQCGIATQASYPVV